MKSRILLILFCALFCFSLILAYNTTASFDGQNPPHAVDIDGKTIPESSATQPDKPIILSKDSQDPKWGELKREAAFDHAKHNTDVKHTLDGKTLTACVYCHHTEQPMPVADKPYLKKSERKEVLTAAQLETSKQPVNSCRQCHFQETTTPTAEYPPKGVRYPRETGMPPSGKLNNENAYHIKCMTCHDAAMKRDATLKAPQGCGDCHVRKSAAGTPASTSSVTPMPTSATSMPTSMPTPTPTDEPQNAKVSLDEMATAIKKLQNSVQGKLPQISPRLAQLGTHVAALQNAVRARPATLGEEPRRYRENLMTYSKVLLLVAERPPTTNRLEQQLNAVEKDFAIKEKFIASRVEEPLSQIEAVIITADKDNREKGGYEVWYVPKGLEDYGAEYRRFDNLSTPAIMLLPPGNYVIWASKESVASARRLLTLGDDGQSKREFTLVVT